LVDQYDWRFVFVAIVPVCVAAMAASVVFLPGRGTGKEAPPPRFDGLGFLLLSAFLIFLLSALSNGQREGWDSDLILTLFAGAFATFFAFVGYELRCRQPLLNLHVFTNGRFAASCLIAFALGAGIYGSTYIIPLFTELVQGYTPTRSGLLLMPAGFGLAVISPLAGHLGDRLPPWVPVMAGLTLFGLSNALCGGADVDTPFLSMTVWVMLGRMGLGLITPSLNAGALRALPPELLAVGSGTVNFVRQLGGALGVNLLSVLIERRTTFHGDALAQAITPASSAASAALQQLGLMLPHWGNPFGTRLPAGVPPSAMHYLETLLVPKARLFAYQDGFMVVAVMFFAALLPALLMRRRSTPPTAR
jgi:EmrB/QacA subfamily drug resistance transporter